MKQKTSLSELLKIHDAIYNLESPPGIIHDCRRAPHINISSIKLVHSPYDIAICLPPKCGTTNWQKAMDVLEILSKEGIQKKITDLKYPELYSILKNLDINDKRIMHPVQASWKKIVNCRNPFSRLYSAWNDKSRTHIDSNGKQDKHYSKYELKQLDIHFHSKYYSGWKIFENGNTPHGRNVSWAAFVKYVAANPGDKGMLAVQAVGLS